MLRFLVCDAYPAAARDGLSAAGATLAGRLYERLLHSLDAGMSIDILYPADADSTLPSGVTLASYDGIVWTGSSLTIYHDHDERVRRQIELARAASAARVPSFGSCWAAQLCVTAAGGRCAANPKGREFGISRVQAVALDSAAPFWAVQYHPEYDLHEIARLCVYRADELVRQGTFASRAAAMTWVEQLQALHAAPQRDDLRRSLGVDQMLLDPAQRSLEARNWIETVVKARLRR